MDVTRNRYFALSAHLDLAFRRLQQEQATLADSTADAAVLADLRKAGVENVADTLKRAQQRDRDHTLPSDQFDVRRGMVSAAFSTTLSVVVLRLALRAMVKLVPLRCVISYARHIRARETRRTGSVKRPIEIAHALAMSDIVLRREGDCLARSLAAFIACAQIDESLSFVIGIRGQPFTAHAWVQVGDTLLTDSIDVIRLYTPIFVI